MGRYATQFQVASAPQNTTAISADVLICPVFQAPAPKPVTTTTGKARLTRGHEDKPTMVWSPALKLLDKATGGHLSALLNEEKFKADRGKCRVIKPRPQDGIQARWIVVLGLGEPDKLKIEHMSSAVMSALKATYGFEKSHQAALLLPEAKTKLSLEAMIQASVLGASESTYKTQEAGQDKIHALKKLSVLVPKASAGLKAVLAEADAMAEAEAMTKDLANKPANLKKADCLAQAALAYADLPGVTVSVVSDQKKLKKEMPCFWAVAQGAAEVDPPRYIKVNYKPTGKIKRKIALVGKGVIFDTGGVQVKPDNYMSDMKFDMTGAASVLAVVKAAAALKLKGVEVSAYVAATANLTGETAFLPDSIVDTASGRKVEIRHTDAEGRLTLADALYKAVQDKPDEIVTIATLTGAASAAVGHGIALMGTDDKLVKRVESACKAMGEPIQAFEFFESDYENVKSDRDGADLLNTSKGKGRGHMTAGAFVLTFAEDIPAAHLDIAGGDAKDGNSTGIAVKGLIRYLLDSAS